MKYIFINNKSSVAYDESISDNIKVEIDGVEHKFEEPDANKVKYAIATKRKKYVDILNRQFENIVVLTGAGSSKDIGKDGKSGKLLTELWDSSETLLTKKVFEQLCRYAKYTDKKDDGSYVKNLEKLLSLAMLAIPFVNTKELNIADCVSKIKEHIRKSCSLLLPDNSPHHILLNKITKRKVTLPRFKLFTLNYDKLFEQAAWQSNFVVIDGFSFSVPRIFSGRNFDYDIVSRTQSRVKEDDNFITKVFHLYKLHGSIDWERNGNTILQNENTSNPLMIYPNQSKYENSYEQPFFEMMSRFQSNLRNENVFLITIGFSFGDKHIVTAIKEALEQNPGFQLMIVNYGIDVSNENLKPFIEAGRKYSNVSIVDETFIEFANYFPDLKAYSQDEQKKIVINLQTPPNE